MLFKCKKYPTDVTFSVSLPYYNKGANSWDVDLGQLIETSSIYICLHNIQKRGGMRTSLYPPPPTNQNNPYPPTLNDHPKCPLELPENTPSMTPPFCPLDSRGQKEP